MEKCRLYLDLSYKNLYSYMIFTKGINNEQKSILINRFPHQKFLPSKEIEHTK